MTTPIAFRVPVEGLDVYVEDHGAGDPLVLLHGALGTIDSCFARLLPALASTRRVIAIELQGHGHTADIDRPLTFARLAADTVAVLDHLGIDRCDLVGYSLGGGVAIETAINHPHRVRRLVYAGGTAYSYDGLYPELLAAFDQPDLAALDGTTWHNAYRAVAPDPDAWPSLVARVNEFDRSRPGWTPDQIRSIGAPCLLVIGDADIVRPEHTLAMFRLLGGGVPGDLVDLPSSRLAVLPATTHVGLLDRIDWLASMIHDFLP